MRIIDSHIHIFNSKIIGNVFSKTGLADRLCLQKKGIYNRLNTTALLNEMTSANVQAALMLPTSDVGNLLTTNRESIKMAGEVPELITAGTLHPGYNDIEEELSYLSNAGVRVIKLCSFSQEFAINQSRTRKMFLMIQNFNENSERPFSVLLDTLTFADQYFGTDPKYITTPKCLCDLAASFPGINIIGAHMGGLGAVFERLDHDLKPLPNLYLDTSNASHTLSTVQFIRMLQTHGPKQILFGTDWPWFIHAHEIERVDQLMEMAGFGNQEKEDVFSRNLEIMLGIA